MTRTVPVTGNEIINMFGVEALRTVVGVASAFDFGLAVVTSEVFFDANKVLWHGSINSP